MGIITGLRKQLSVARRIRYHKVMTRREAAIKERQLQYARKLVTELEQTMATENDPVERLRLNNHIFRLRMLAAQKGIQL